jgi:glyoxylate reductase
VKVFATCRLPGKALERLKAFCKLDIWERPEPIPPALLAERLQGCSGLLCLLTNRIDTALIEGSPQLRFVSSMSVGVDHVDVEALTERAIPLGHTPGVLVDTTADLAVGLLLAAARRIPEADGFVRGGHWDPALPWHPGMFVGKDVAGSTVGVLGLGAIGRAFASRMQGFGARVIGWNRTPGEFPGIETVGFEDLLGRSDFLSVHLALTADTRNLLNEAAITAMKPAAVLINTARGGIVDEHALAAALGEGRLFAAGIDVFSREPVEPENPLLTLPNVVLAPHIGSASQRTRARMADLAVDNLLAALRGERMPHCVNPQVYEGLNRR